MATICLNMIVKNEARIIERCLASVLPAIDCYVICDTGSADDTAERIRAFFDRHGVPGSVHFTQFVNFAQARNEALDLCKASGESFDYILLADADMELVIDTDDFKARLGAPAYTVRQCNGLSYYNIRMVRRDVPARYVGATHEYLQVGAAPIRLEEIHFIDHACGASRVHKTVRDLVLLEQELAVDPHNTRAMFYLAQTYKDAGRFGEAAEWYQKRISAGGWPEEVWYSKLMLAGCRKHLGYEDAFVRLCLDAYDYRPSRAESLHALAKHYRTVGRHEACMMLCEVGESIRYPAEDSLFIDAYVYAMGFQEEMSISGFYCRSDSRRRRGREACLALATSRAAPGTTRLTARNNSVFYTRSAEEMFPGFTAKQLAVDVPSGYTAMNPSICLRDGRPAGIVRCVNYRIENGAYVIDDPDDVVRTRNLLVTLTEDYEVAESVELVDRSDSPRESGSLVVGFEDCRLFYCRSGWWASCTVRDRNPAWRAQVALLQWEADGSVTSLRLMDEIEPGRHEKNWMPLVCGEELYFIYSTGPTRILHCDLDGSRLREHRRSEPALALEHLRGSSQAIPLPHGWLYLTHEAVGHQGSRNYLHRFVHLDDDLRVRAVSDPFFFRQRGIEFCAGLVHDKRRGEFVVSFGVNDAEAMLGFFDQDAVLSALRSV